MRHQYGISVTPYFSTMPLEYGDAPIATYALLTWLGSIHRDRAQKIAKLVSQDHHRTLVIVFVEPA